MSQTFDELKQRVIAEPDTLTAVKLLSKEAGYGLATARDLVSKWHREAKIEAGIERAEKLAAQLTTTIPYPKLCEIVATLLRDQAEMWRLFRDLN